MTAPPPADPAPPPPPPRHWPFVLAAILLIAGSVRFAGIGRDCLWFDELWHLTISNGRGSAQYRIPVDQYVASLPDHTSLATAEAWWKIPRRDDPNAHPPLYYFPLRLWRAAFGDAPATLRALSAILSIAAVAATFDLGRLSMGTSGGLWAAALLAVAPGQVEQAQEVRGYTLLLLLATLAASAALRGARAGPRGAAWPALVVLSMPLLMFTHYFAAGACAAIAGYAVMTYRGRARAIVAIGVPLVALAWIAAWAPALRAMANALPDTADAFLNDPAPAPALATAARLAALPARLMIGAPVNGWTVAAGMAAWAAAAWALARRPATRLPILCLACTGTMLAALDWSRATQHLSFTRYGLIASPGVAVALAAATAALPRPWTAPARWGVLGLLAALLPVYGYERNNLDFRPLAAHLRENAREGDAVVLLSPNPLGRDGQTVYLHLAYYGRIFPRAAAVATRPITPGPLADALAKHRRVWLVSANPRVDAARAWPGARELSAARFEPVGSAILVEPP